MAISPRRLDPGRPELGLHQAHARVCREPSIALGRGHRRVTSYLFPRFHWHPGKRKMHRSLFCGTCLLPFITGASKSPTITYLPPPDPWFAGLCRYEKGKVFLVNEMA